MKEVYTIGLDYGTRSARALLVRVSDGLELGYTEYVYPHGVMESAIPTGEKLDSNWALQHPADYLNALKECIAPLILKCGIDAKDVIGIGIDFTACTVLPVKKDGTPLCLIKEFEREPHTYVKLWKHHAAQYCADMINQKADENLLASFGGKISSEFYHPKLLQTMLEAPRVTDFADFYIEAGDWIVWLLTGKMSRSASMAGYKALYTKEHGYPSKDFLNSVCQGFGDTAERLLQGDILPVGSVAGGLCKEYAEITGLTEGTPVTSCIIDAHSALLSARITDADKMLMILGTSGCYISLGKEYKKVDGVYAIVQDGIENGFYGYESGQSALGDQFHWLSCNMVSKEIQRQAESSGIKVLDLLSQKAALQKPGSSGLLALDWWNGNRSVLNDGELSGMIVGLTLTTKPEDIYSALVEAIAFGTRKIIENYEQSSVFIKELYACGSLSKNNYIMQVYADVLGKEIKICASENGSALGSAIFAATATGEYSLKQAAKQMGRIKDISFVPNMQNKEIYDRLYKQYELLHDYFGKGANNVMKELLKLK